MDILDIDKFKGLKEVNDKLDHLYYKMVSMCDDCEERKTQIDTNTKRIERIIKVLYLLAGGILVTAGGEQIVKWVLGMI